MRRSAWTVGAAVLAALSLGVAACGGSDDSGGRRGPTPGRIRRRRKRSRAASSRSCGPATSITSTAARPTTRWAISSATRRRSSSTTTSRTTATTMVAGPRRGRSAGLRGRQDRHGQDQEGRQVLAALRQGSHLGRRQVRDRARLLHLGGQRLHRVVLRGPRGREGRRQGRHRDRAASRRPTTQTLVLKFKRAVGGVMASGALAYGARPRRCRRSTRRSSTPRPRRPTARTSSPPART